MQNLQYDTRPRDNKILKNLVKNVRFPYVRGRFALLEIIF